MDNLDRAIIDILRGDGRVSNSEIGRRIGVSEGTIRRRLRNLIDGDMIDVRVMVDPKGRARSHRSVVGIIADPRCVDAVLEQVGQFEEVTFAAITTGRYDLIVFVGVDSPERLREFLTARLGAVPGVERTETSVVLTDAGYGLDSFPDDWRRNEPSR